VLTVITDLNLIVECLGVPHMEISVVHPPVVDEDRLGLRVSKRKPAHPLIVVPNHGCASFEVVIGLPVVVLVLLRLAAGAHGVVAPPLALTVLAVCPTVVVNAGEPRPHQGMFPPNSVSRRRFPTSARRRRRTRCSLTIQAMPSASPTSAAVTRHRTPSPPRQSSPSPSIHRLQTCPFHSWRLSSPQSPPIAKVKSPGVPLAVLPATCGNRNCLLRRSRARAEPHSGHARDIVDPLPPILFSVSPPHPGHPPSAMRAIHTGAHMRSLLGHVGGVGRRTC